MKELKINSSDENQRLDKYLMKYFNKAPKSFIYKMLRKKRIKLNSKKAEGNEILKNGDILNMYLAEETISGFMEEKEIQKCSQDFKIIFEDSNIIICFKPAGLIVHPDNENQNNTLNDQLLYYLYQKNEYDISSEATFKPAICNRLDRNTSGIVVMGKNLASVQALNKAFRDNEVDKYYLTVVKGCITQKGSIKGWHIKGENNTVKIYNQPKDGAKIVETIYEPIKFKNGMTLLKIKLITGKAHQIRASLKNQGFPIAGDRKYGDFEFNKEIKKRFGLDNQLLHCSEIIFKQKNTCLEYLYNKKFTSQPIGCMKNVIDSFND